MDAIKERICREVESLSETLFAVSRYLKDNPETAYQEFKACEHLSNVLTDLGFTVEKGVGKVETAFLARPSGRKPTRPSVALLAEYDALPKIGHGCGHNLIAAAGVGAAAALSRILGDAAGSVALVGTPAEEGGGGKARLAEAGVFKEMDAAIMFHPGQLNIPGKDMLGRIKFRMEFFGKTAHAASSPDKGINALDAIVAAYSAINALRQHLRPDARIHGVITHGGDAPNIIPDYTAGLFYVRAGSRSYRDEVFERVKKCAEGAATAVGATVKIHVELPTIDPMNRNPSLEAAVRANMELLGIAIDSDDGRRGSSDIGNLGYYLPALHPVLAMTGHDTPNHTVGFCEATVGPRGREAMINGAKIVAMTAYDFLSSETLRKKAAEDFNRSK
ncbi:MAG: M20 family peptidase [Desulfobacteraceae bacterium]|nr:MAG: M20 family peptidase [Desulfobacteraceae bacterium]